MRRCFSSVYLHFFPSVCLLGERRCVVFLSRMHVRALSYAVAVCLYPGAVLPPSDPRYSYVLTVEDRSPGLKLPHIHPSEGSQRQPSTRIYSFSCRCKTKYSAASCWFILACRGEARVWRRLQSCIFSGTTVFSLNFLPSLMPH